MMGMLFIISAPSGAGKSSIVDMVTKLTEYPLRRVVTYTTRKPRHNEQDGVDYHFISSIDFQERIEKNFFLEYSTAYHDYYGSPHNILDNMRKGESYIMITDRKGAAAIKERVGTNAIFIWITVPIDELKVRLVRRGFDSQQSIDRRCARALIEIEEEKRDSFFEYHVENRVFNTAVSTLLHIIKSHLIGLNKS